MVTVIIRILLVLTVPIPFLVLARGLRVDRIFFTLYLVTIWLTSFLIAKPLTPGLLHIILFLTSLGLLWLNLFLTHRAHFESKGVRLIFLSLAVTLPSVLAVLFLLDYLPDITQSDFYFPHPLYPSLVLLTLALSLITLVTWWEKVMTVTTLPRAEKIFHWGIIFWWVLCFFLLIKMVYSGDRVSVTMLRMLFASQLVWTLGVYVLMIKYRFLQIRAHPSPQLLGHTTQTILILGALALFFWFEALGKTWELPPYSVTAVTLAFLAAVLLFPLFPFRSFHHLQRIFYHHLYLPEQDFAIEVSHYLKVMRGEENLEKIMEHLRSRLKIESAALYRHNRAVIPQWTLYLASPRQRDLPVCFTSVPVKGVPFGDFPVIQAAPLEGAEGVLGYLLFSGDRRTFDQEEESLIRFWSKTLGLLLQELELRERERTQEKLTYFSQATSFLLHDAKNLAQLLDLLLKNAHNLQGEELVAFFRESLPALEQARTRSRRILEKLETFQPGNHMPVTDNDVRDILERIVTSLCLSLKREQVFLSAPEKKFPWQGDEETLRTVMENLILNGLQASPPEGSVEVKLHEEEQGYHIEVRDGGEDISDDQQARIFEPFFTTRRGGSGLGLYQAKILVERMGGVVWYEPNKPTGSVMHVRIGKHSHR